MKGIRSLLEESLIITRDMLREAQLAYPRNPVRDIITSYREMVFKSQYHCHDQIICIPQVE